MTEKDFVTPEEILTFFVVSRKTEAFRKALDKNITLTLFSHFLLFLAQPRWQSGLVSIPNYFGTQSLGVIKTCYLFPVGYS